MASKSDIPMWLLPEHQATKQHTHHAIQSNFRNSIFLLKDLHLQCWSSSPPRERLDLCGEQPTSCGATAWPRPCTRPGLETLMVPCCCVISPMILSDFLWVRSGLSLFEKTSLIKQLCQLCFSKKKFMSIFPSQTFYLDQPRYFPPNFTAGQTLLSRMFFRCGRCPQPSLQMSWM